MEIPDFGSSLVDVAIRTSIIYAVLVAGLRLAGKREVGQLSIFDLIVLLVIADAVQNSMVGENSTLLGGVVAALVLITLDRVLNVVTGRFPRIKKLLEGAPQELIRDGVVLEAALRKEGIDRDELAANLRAHGILEASEVALAVLETNGSISVIPRRPDGGIETASAPPPQQPTF
jgi:uncharacterized membrane protein YcaP (DUF421 family)